MPKLRQVTSGFVAASLRRAAGPVWTDDDAILAGGPVFAPAVGARRSPRSAIIMGDAVRPSRPRRTAVQERQERRKVVMERDDAMRPSSATSPGPYSGGRCSLA
jgi:hypothetical protein